jgi:hypothetical protein
MESGRQIEITAGPSTTLRFGRDDKFVAKTALSRRTFGCKTELSSRPERSVVEGPAVIFLFLLLVFSGHEKKLNLAVFGVVDIGGRSEIVGRVLVGHARGLTAKVGPDESDAGAGKLHP